MSTDINLYKINDVDEFDENIQKEYDIYSKIHDDQLQNLNDVDVNLYLFKEPVNSKIKWEWILDSFGKHIDSYLAKPKAILVINKENNCYAISFGYAYAFVGKYADKNWPLKFAERMDYLSVKSVGILAPNSLVNRKIYNYFNYNFLDVDSGEALNNISVKLKLNEDISEFLSDHVIIGNSIKFRIIKDELIIILNLINFVEEVLENSPKREIPKLKKIDNKAKIHSLNKKLNETIQNDILSEKEKYSINISEFSVDGFQYVFFNNDFDNFGFELGNKNDISTVLNVESIYEFIRNTNLQNSDNLLDLKITMVEGDNLHVKSLKDFIMYVGDENIYIDGNWYQYNKLLVDSIHNTLSDIPVYYDDAYDFITKEKFESSRENLKKKLNEDKDWYFEYFFNKRIEYLNEGYICLDRDMTQIKNHKLEEADLFDEKDGAMYAVKAGNSSGSFSYVVDQSVYALKLLDDNQLSKLDKNQISKVGLWLIFKSGEKNKFTIKDNCLNWDEVNMLILKSKIADWKRQVLLSGREPIIRINYKYKDS